MLPLNVQPLAVPRMLPACLGFVAGFIDACTFFALFHFFVAQLTGSFVIVGSEFVELDQAVKNKIYFLCRWVAANLDFNVVHWRS